MAETVKETMDKIIFRQRPLFRGNGILTTGHLSYFKPITTPKKILDKHFLLREFITVNPLTSLVTVSGLLFFVLDTTKGGYTKPYRTFKINEEAVAGLNKEYNLSIGEDRLITAVTIPKRYYDEETYTLKSHDEIGDVIVRKTIDKKYIGELISLSVTEDEVGNLSNAFDIELVHRDIHWSFNTKDGMGVRGNIYNPSTYTVKYDSNKIVTKLMLDSLDFLSDRCSFLNYEYTFIPKFDDEIRNIVDFYEAVVSGKLWNENGEYEGSNFEVIENINGSTFFTDGTILNEILYKRTYNDKGSVNYELLDLSLYSGTTPLQSVFVKDNDSYTPLFAKYYNKFTTLRERSIRYSENSIDDGPYHPGYTDYQTIEIVSPKELNNHLKYLDNDTYTYVNFKTKDNDKAYVVNRSQLNVEYPRVSTYLNKLIIHGAFNLPIDKGDKESEYGYTIKFHDRLNYALTNGNLDEEKARRNYKTLLDNFKKSNYYIDENSCYIVGRYNNSDLNGLDSVALYDYTLNNLGSSFHDSTLVKRMDGLTSIFNSFSVLSDKSEALKRRIFLETLFKIRKGIASYISGIGSYALDFDFQKTIGTNKSSLSLFTDYEDGSAGEFSIRTTTIAPHKTYTPTETVYDKIILGKDDDNPYFSFLISFYIAKRMTVKFNGKTYTFYNTPIPKALPTIDKALDPIHYTYFWFTKAPFSFYATTERESTFNDLVSKEKGADIANLFVNHFVVSPVNRFVKPLVINSDELSILLRKEDSYPALRYSLNHEFSSVRQFNNIVNHDKINEAYENLLNITDEETATSGYNTLYNERNNANIYLKSDRTFSHVLRKALSENRTGFEVTLYFDSFGLNVEDTLNNTNNEVSRVYRFEHDVWNSPIIKQD